VISIPVLNLLNRTSYTQTRDDFDVFGLGMASPLMFLLPAFAVLLCCTRLFQDIGHRYISAIRTRTSIRRYLLRSYARSALVAFVLFFLLSFACFLVAFYLWPSIGNPNVHPASYYLTPGSAIRDSYSRVSYSSILELGLLPYGLLYSTWVGVGGAIFAAMGIASLLLVKKRALAIAVPFLIYFGETVFATLLGSPQAALVYSLFPFGITPTTPILAAMPILLTALLLAVIVSLTIARADNLEVLS
jgi:hypothetical protein